MGERIFTTMDDVKSDVINTLVESGQRVEDYDVDAIAKLTHRYGAKTDEEGNELLNTAGFRCVVGDVEFWHIVIGCAYTPEQRLAAAIDEIEDPYVREWALAARDMGLRVIISPDDAEIVILSVAGPAGGGLWIKGESRIWAHEDGRWGKVTPLKAVGVLGRMRRATGV